MTMGAEREVAELHFAAGLFDLDAYKKAAYRMSERADIELHPADGAMRCLLRSRVADTTPDALAAEFRQHVLDYDLRGRIAKETEPVRNLILAHAFSKTGLQG